MFFPGSHLGPVPVEIQANPLPQVIRGNGSSVCPVSGFLIKTKGFSFYFACVLSEKSLIIGRFGSAKELFKKFKKYSALLKHI